MAGSGNEYKEADRITREQHLAAAVDERISAEKKVAEGIKRLNEKAKEEGESKEYDVQGIATVTLEADEIDDDIKDLFPNQLKNGIRLHFYQPNYLRHPPLTYMLQQKVASLCKAAKKLIITDQEKRIQEHIKNLYEEEFKNFNQDQKIFHQKAKKLMEIVVDETITELYKAYKSKLREHPNLLSKNEFAKKIIKISETERSDTKDILIFNEENNTFSYEESNSVTAHDKRIGQHCANLSTSFEGNYTQKRNFLAKMEEREGGGGAVPVIEEVKGAEKEAPMFLVTCSLIKHASLAPDKDLVSWRIFDPWESNIHCLIKACNDVEEIVMKEARLRQHGREPENENDPIHIEWGYQLLTTNFFNIDKQAINYGYAVKAVQCMSGVDLVTETGMPVHTEIHLFNAGINRWAAWNLFQKKDTQRVQNRNAYIHFTEILRDRANELTNLPGLQGSSILTLKNAVLGDPIKINRYHELQTELAANANNFNQARKNYNENYARLDTKVKRLEIRYKTTKSAKDYQAYNDAKREREHLLTEIQACLSLSKRKHAELRKVTAKIEKDQRKQWENQQQEIKRLITTIKQTHLNEANPLTQLELKQLLTVTALVYKSYMDDLYYSGKYRDPQYAALFNGYMASYQRAIGMMPTIGCKSANDRTFVVRLFYTALNQEPGLTPFLPELPAIPNNYHEPKEAVNRLAANMAGSIMANAGMHACIADTGGGAPKVDSKKFHYFKIIKDVVDSISKFGKYAAHQLKVGLRKIMDFPPHFRVK